jgi:protoheme IX farnesyltransferase
MGLFRSYYKALKPERTYANVMTTAAGFLFASRWHIDWGLLSATLIGTTCVVMSACAVNNCTDCELDTHMPRTKKRATATGEVSLRTLAVMAAFLGFAGFITLAFWVNWPVVLLGIIGYIDYVIVYAWTKRTTPWSTLAGTVSGAVPLMAGYVAVIGRFDVTALLLGLVMVFWQMPHFYSIGIFRLKDYQAGGLPIWPVKYGVRSTQVWILVFTTLYLLAVVLLSTFGSTGLTFAVVISLMALYWLSLGLKGLSTQKPEKWARGMFGVSLINLLVLSAALAVCPLLP